MQSFLNYILKAKPRLTLGRIKKPAYNNGPLCWDFGLYGTPVCISSFLQKSTRGTRNSPEALWITAEQMRAVKVDLGVGLMCIIVLSNPRKCFMVAINIKRLVNL